MEMVVGGVMWALRRISLCKVITGWTKTPLSPVCQRIVEKQDHFKHPVSRYTRPPEFSSFTIEKTFPGKNKNQPE